MDPKLVSRLGPEPSKAVPAAKTDEYQGHDLYGLTKDELVKLNIMPPLVSKVILCNVSGAIYYCLSWDILSAYSMNVLNNFIPLSFIRLMEE